VLTDPADDKTFGTLRWQVAGAPGGFKNARFGTAATTAPNGNAYSFEVDRDMKPDVYDLTFTVTSSKTGKTSAVTTVSVVVLPPIAIGALINDAPVYEEDESGRVGFSTDAQFLTTDDGQIADFNAGGISTSSVPSGSGFGLPGLDLAKANLAKTPFCLISIVPRTSTLRSDDPSAQAQFFMLGFCSRTKITEITAYVRHLDVNDHKPIAPTTETALRCSEFEKLGPLTVCRTPVVDVRSASGRSERVTIGMKYSETQLPTTPVWNFPDRFVINKKNAYYPLVDASVWQWPRGKWVVFPPQKLKYCPKPRTAPGCTKKNGLAKILEGDYVPSDFYTRKFDRYEAHHIQPLSWGGEDNIVNGVWLPDSIHQNFSTWWLPINFAL
jgi:hypothetical protein